MTKTELKSRLKETIRAELEVKLSAAPTYDTSLITTIKKEIEVLDKCETLGSIFILLHTLGYLVDEVLYLTCLAVLDGDEISLADERFGLVPDVWKGLIYIKK